jgi:hypothetical protein
MDRLFAIATITLGLALAAPRPARADATAAGAPPSTPPAEEIRPARSPQQMAIWIGFSHWYGETFGSPDGIGTPAFAFGVRPGLAFLDVRVRYTVAIDALELPDGEPSNVGFLSLELALTHGLSLGRQRLDVFAGPLAGVVHADGGSGIVGVVLGSRLMIAAGRDLAIGGFFEGRQVFYVLPDDPEGILEQPRRDGQLDLGVVATFF